MSCALYRRTHSVERLMPYLPSWARSSFTTEYTGWEPTTCPQSRQEKTRSKGMQMVAAATTTIETTSARTPARPQWRPKLMQSCPHATRLLLTIAARPSKCGERWTRSVRNEGYLERLPATELIRGLQCLESELCKAKRRQRSIIIQKQLSIIFSSNCARLKQSDDLRKNACARNARKEGAKCRKQ